MKFRKGLVSLVLMGLLAVGSVAGATPASDALAREDEVATKLVYAIKDGQTDYAAFKPLVDGSRMDIAEFAKAAKMDEAKGVKDVYFVGFERLGEFDAVSYIGTVSDKKAVFFRVIFDANTGMISGLTMNGLEKKQ